MSTIFVCEYWLNLRDFVLIINRFLNLWFLTIVTAFFEIIIAIVVTNFALPLSWVLIYLSLRLEWFFLISKNTSFAVITFVSHSIINFLTYLTLPAARTLRFNIFNNHFRTFTRRDNIYNSWIRFLLFNICIKTVMMLFKLMRHCEFQGLNFGWANRLFLNRLLSFFFLLLRVN